MKERETKDNVSKGLQRAYYVISVDKNHTLTSVKPVYFICEYETTSEDSERTLQRDRHKKTEKKIAVDR